MKSLKLDDGSEPNPESIGASYETSRDLSIRRYRGNVVRNLVGWHELSTEKDLVSVRIYVREKPLYTLITLKNKNEI